VKKIVLTTINAKWIHPSLALRLLKANLGSLEDSCEIMEFALRQPLSEKLEPLLAAFVPNGHVPDGRARILGISVSIWNHIATLELLKELGKQKAKPVIVLGGPEVSHLPENAEIFQYADYVIRGEGETAFRLLCEEILAGEQAGNKFINAENVNVCEIKTAYHLYTDEDVTKKLTYIESSRGCVFNCEFCLSAVKTEGKGSAVREFPLEQFLAEMDTLIQRGAKTFKFLDRSFNVNINRSLQIIEFFLGKLNSSSSLSSSSASPRLCERSSSNISSSSASSAPLRLRENSSLNIPAPFTVHFEMVPSLFPQELLEALTRFPPGTLRLEIGIQTLNPEVSARIGRPYSGKELDALRFLREKTNAIIHADLIAGLPGEDIVSFGKGFDLLWQTVGVANSGANSGAKSGEQTEIQPGILKLLPGALISRHNETFGMRYNSLPPYEVEETSVMSAEELGRIKNFARFWETIVNRGLIELKNNEPIFDKFMALSDSLLAHFGKNWGIDKAELRMAVEKYTII